MKTLKITSALLAVCLLLCLCKMPYGYYTFIRFATMIVAAIWTFIFYNEKKMELAVVVGSVALLFQPFVKIALGRTVWNVVDVVVAVGLLACIVYYNKLESRKKLDEQFASIGNDSTEKKNGKRIYLRGIEHGEPFFPTCKEVIFANFAGNRILDDFFSRILDKVKALFKEKRDYEFIYIPTVVKEYGDLNTLKYYHPLTTEPSKGKIRFVETMLLNKHLHLEDGNKLAPGLIHFMNTECISKFDGIHKGCYEYSYFPLVAGSDDAIMDSLRDYISNCGESYCHIGYNHPDSSEFCEADNSFLYAQEQYYDVYKERNLSGIKRYIIDSLCSTKDDVSRIEVTENGDVFLKDFNVKIDMRPVVKAIYLLFLCHPEGIVLKDLPKYQNELNFICEKLGVNDKMDLKTLSYYAMNPNMDVIGRFCGEMYAMFREHMDDKMAFNYTVQTYPYNFNEQYRTPYLSKSEPKKIMLDRSLVIWDKKFSTLSESSKRSLEQQTVFLFVFYAEWCNVSKQFVKEIKKSGLTGYMLVDLEKNESFVNKYNIRNIPMAILEDMNQNIIKQWVRSDKTKRVVEFVKSGNYELLDSSACFDIA